MIVEYDAGRVFDPGELDEWEWRGVVAWRQYEETFRRLQWAKLITALTAQK